MADASIRIEGLDKLMKKVKSLEQLEAVKGGIAAAAVHVKGKIAKYPSCQIWPKTRLLVSRPSACAPC